MANATLQTITGEALVRLLKAHRGASFVTIEAETKARLLKTGLPEHLKGAIKKARVNGIIGWIYSNSVNNQRLREEKPDNFTAHPRKWGTRYGAVLIHHNGTYYIELKVEKSLGHEYTTANGDPVSKDEIAPYLPKRKDSGRQQVEKPVILRDYKIDSIATISYKGETYKVI